MMKTETLLQLSSDRDSEHVVTWAVKQDVVILGVAETLLQPHKVVGEVLHAEDQAPVRAKAQRVVLHDVLHLDELPDV